MANTNPWVDLALSAETGNDVDKQMADADDLELGGSGSGNFGHAGIPGQRGGSAGKGDGDSKVTESDRSSYKASNASARASYATHKTSLPNPISYKSPVERATQAYYTEEPLEREALHRESAAMHERMVKLHADNGDVDASKLHAKAAKANLVAAEMAKKQGGGSASTSTQSTPADQGNVAGEQSERSERARKASIDAVKTTEGEDHASYHTEAMSRKSAVALQLGSTASTPKEHTATANAYDAVARAFSSMAQKDVPEIDRVQLDKAQRIHNNVADLHRAAR